MRRPSTGPTLRAWAFQRMGPRASMYPFTFGETMHNLPRTATNWLASASAESLRVAKTP